MSNIGYDRKLGETADDRLKVTLAALRVASLEDYSQWVKGYIAAHGRKNVELVDEAFPDGEFFVAVRPVYVQHDCSMNLSIIVPKSVHYVLRRDECSVILREDGYTITEGKKVLVYSDMQI